MTDLAVGVPRGRPWGRAALWLAGLAPLFYLTYGFANWLASQRAEVPSVVFGWERDIPFWSWTILPYWSINAFYGASLFVCADRDELDTHGRRLLTAQAISVAFFLLLPLRFSFERPDTGTGLAAVLFDALLSFDKPFNQAPSLHIALLVILWELYGRHVHGWARPLLDIWFLLIGASVLTTYQHHFIDIPTGALCGLVCAWLWPFGRPSPLVGASRARDPRRRSLALRYGAGAIILGGLALTIGGWGLWLAWPAVSLLLVALCYAAVGVDGFQKHGDGRVSLASRWLFAPYRLGAWINSRLWTFGELEAVPVAEGVFLGRMPGRGKAADFTTLVDLTAELRPPPRPAIIRSVPLLDLVTPDPEALGRAAVAIDLARRDGSVLVCCALGYSRSAAAVASWLVRAGIEPDVDQAVERIRAVRPRIRLDAGARSAIRKARGSRP